MLRSRSSLLVVLLAAAMVLQAGCAGEGTRTDLFTVALYNVGEGPDEAANPVPNTLIYLPYVAEPSLDLGQGCFFHEYNLVGQAERYTWNASPTQPQYVRSHAEDQGTNTYAHFTADGAQAPLPATCVPQFDAEFDAGSRFTLSGTLLAPFMPARSASDRSVKSGEFAAKGFYTTDGSFPTAQNAEGQFYFYDFEIVREQLGGPLSVTGPGR